MAAATVQSLTWTPTMLTVVVDNLLSSPVQFVDSCLGTAFVCELLGLRCCCIVLIDLCVREGFAGFGSVS